MTTLAGRWRNQGAPSWVKRAANFVPYVGGLIRQRDALRTQAWWGVRLQAAQAAAVNGRKTPGRWEGAEMIAPPGHFYSPLPSLPDIKADEDRIFQYGRELSAIDIRSEAQLALLKEWTQYYRETPFTAFRDGDLRYQFENPAYSYGDGTFLHCMIRHAKPQRIIEIGSGWSSCVTLDTNERFFDNSIECAFIDPYPEMLLGLLKPGDRRRVRVIKRRVQDVELSIFQELRANDILFIDSTHVSKTGSDVNYEIFEILPRLSPGVYVHFHDLFYPFEYPRDWVFEGRAWNEAYLLRGFLEFNDAFEIVIWNDYLAKLHRETLASLMPDCLNNTGASLWLRRKR